MIGDSNGVGDILTLYSCAKGSDINGSINIHYRILHTGISRFLDSKTGGFDRRVIKIQFGL